MDITCDSITTKARLSRIEKTAQIEQTRARSSPFMNYNTIDTSAGCDVWMFSENVQTHLVLKLLLFMLLLVLSTTPVSLHPITSLLHPIPRLLLHVSILAIITLDPIDVVEHRLLHDNYLLRKDDHNLHKFLKNHTHHLLHLLVPQSDLLRLNHNLHWLAW